MAFATTPITSSGQGCGGPGGGGGGAGGVVSLGGGVVEDDADAVSEMLGGGFDDDAAAALAGWDCGSSEPNIPTIQITSSSVTSAAPIAAMRRRQYTVDGSGPVGSITART